MGIVGIIMAGISKGADLRWFKYKHSFFNQLAMFDHRRVKQEHSEAKNSKQVSSILLNTSGLRNLQQQNEPNTVITTLHTHLEGGAQTQLYKIGPPNDSVQLVYNSNFTVVYGTYKYSIHRGLLTI